MSSAAAFVATPIATDRAGGLSRLWVKSLLTFWLPVAIILFATYALEHNTHYASAQFLKDGDGKDVTELADSGSSVRQLGLLMLGGIGAGWLLLSGGEAVRPKLGLLVLVVAAFSLLFLGVLWADDWILTVKRAIQPTLMMIGALGIVKHWQPRQLCLFAAISCGVLLLVGVFAVLAQGTFGQGDPYRFGGTLHPNGQAVNCAILCLASLALFSDQSRSEKYRWLWLTGLMVGLCFLYLTRSRTTVAALFVSVGIFFFLGGSWTRRFFIVAIPVAAFAFGALLVALPDTGAEKAISDAVTMGRVKQDTSKLTGRLPIWEAVLGAISEQPMLGYGYGGFWTPQRVWEFSFIHHWEFNHAHSAYFESVLNVGLIGLAIGLMILFATGWGAARAFAATGDNGFRFAAAVIPLALVHGFADSNFVQPGFAPLLVMMCVALVALHGGSSHATSPAQQREPIQLTFKTSLNY